MSGPWYTPVNDPVYDDVPYDPAPPRVRQPGAPRRVCVHCNWEVTDDGLGELIHARNGLYGCRRSGKPMDSVAELTKGPATAPGTERPKRNWGRRSPSEQKR